MLGLVAQAGMAYVSGPPETRVWVLQCLEPVGPTQLKVSGCLVGGLLCRSQIWHRA